MKSPATWVSLKKQFYSNAKHYLLRVLGRKWKEVNVAMITVYIDDSGTAPDQKVAIASALVIPSKRIVALDREWEKLKAKRGFTDFHTSECVHKNYKSEFADWDDRDVKQLLAKVRNLTKKYGFGAVSIAINKSDYDQVVSEEMRDLGGNHHYTWAVRHVLSTLLDWARYRNVPMPVEYVFDWMEKGPAKTEVETAMAQMECDFPGLYAGHYTFKKREDFPALQCTDLLAWSCYQFALNAFTKKPLHPLAEKSFWDFEKYKKSTGEPWLYAVAQTRKQTEEWVSKEMSNDAVRIARKKWAEEYRSKKKNIAAN